MDTAGDKASTKLWANRAASAEAAVTTRHMARVWRLPFTQLGIVAWPPSPKDLQMQTWHYWWQAHLLDCLVDAQLRDPEPERLKRVRAQLRGHRLKNSLRWTNDYYDDMAWLALSIERADRLLGVRRARALKTLTKQFTDAWMPELATKRFRWSASKQGRATDVKDGQRTPGKVAIFATCYVNYNEPGIGHDLLKVLDHNEIPYVLVEKEKCCGMPKLELGDLDSVNASKEANIPVLAKYAKDGFAILSAVPSCTLMFKQELPLMYPDDTDVQQVKDAMWDPFEYLMQRKRDGLLKTEFTKPLGKISYQIPCHGRVQNIGKKTEEMLKMIPQTWVQTNERCSGHAGTFGVKKAYHPMAMKIGKPLFKKMADHPGSGKAQDGSVASAPGVPDWISSDCPLGGHHIAQGFEVNQLGNPTLAHPLTLVRMAYGIN